ncbi:transposable element Tc1 transposase, partial [Tuber indicum]
SADLNLIEALWSDLETELGQIYERAEDVDTLILIVQATWRTITPERLSKLIATMPNRLAAVIAAEGNATKY